MWSIDRVDNRRTQAIRGHGDGQCRGIVLSLQVSYGHMQAVTECSSPLIFQGCSLIRRYYVMVMTSSSAPACVPQRKRDRSGIITNEATALDTTLRTGIGFLLPFGGAMFCVVRGNARPLLLSLCITTLHAYGCPVIPAYSRSAGRVILHVCYGVQLNLCCEGTSDFKYA